MEKHPSYPALKGYLQKYPKSRGAIYQTYNDIVYGQQWSDVEIVDAPQIGRAVVSGRRPEQKDPSLVIPCGLGETMSFDWLTEAFKNSPSANNPDIYLGISGDDSSIVYYKISPGIIKPKN
ncbi:hypothetical protein FRC08_001677 [Ceratobasidium sp. 394]|nr:hypothetical protein FRC08_001677 [Ceratobasidium sp. 394]